MTGTSTIKICRADALVAKEVVKGEARFCFDNARAEDDPEYRAEWFYMFAARQLVYSVFDSLTSSTDPSTEFEWFEWPQIYLPDVQRVLNDLRTSFAPFLSVAEYVDNTVVASAQQYLEDFAVRKADYEPERELLEIHGKLRHVHGDGIETISA